MVSSTEKPGPVGFRSPGLRECRSAVIIRVDAVFFQVPPEGGLADAEFGRHLLAVAVMLFSAERRSRRPSDPYRGRSVRSRAASVGRSAPAAGEEHFVDVPLLGQQHEPLADAVELVQIAGPLMTPANSAGPPGSGGHSACTSPATRPDRRRSSPGYLPGGGAGAAFRG